MKKEEAIKKIQSLDNSYNYWFEVFRRSTNPLDKVKAKAKYKEAIEEIIILQKEFNLRIPPHYSSRERKEMQLDDKNERLIFSDKQLLERNILEEFDKQKKALEENIVITLKNRKSEYIKEILDRMSSPEFALEKNAINNILIDLKYFESSHKQSIEIKTQLLSPIIIFRFGRFLSGEMYIDNLDKLYNEAINRYKINDIEKANYILFECRRMIEKAADFSLLQIGRRYFNLRLEKLSDDWHSFVKTIEEQEKHEKRLHLIKENVLTIVNRRPCQRMFAFWEPS